jgi:hypothetical protein
MSYNYLPLDKNPTNFQQIKNLLAHDQLVSITFDAYDRITRCRKYKQPVLRYQYRFWFFTERTG